MRIQKHKLHPPWTDAELQKLFQAWKNSDYFEDICKQFPHRSESGMRNKMTVMGLTVKRRQAA